MFIERFGPMCSFRRIRIGCRRLRGVSNFVGPGRLRQESSPLRGGRNGSPPVMIDSRTTCFGTTKKTVKRSRSWCDAYGPWEATPMKPRSRSNTHPTSTPIQVTVSASRHLPSPKCVGSQNVRTSIINKSESLFGQVVVFDAAFNERRRTALSSESTNGFSVGDPTHALSVEILSLSGMVPPVPREP